MGQPIALQGDLIVTACTHQVKGQPPGAPPPPPIVAPLPGHTFVATLDLELSTTVKAGGKFIALKGSKAIAKVHLPLTPPGTAPLGFVAPPNNQAEVIQGSTTVKIQGKPVARIGDPIKTCSELSPPHGSIIPAGGTQVFVG